MMSSPLGAREQEIVLAGWAHTPFGKQDATLEQLITTVANDAIASAGITAADVDEIVLGTFNAGMQPLAFASSLALQADDGLWGKPATRVENACASGAAAFRTGVHSILAGEARTVLVIGAEKMTDAGAEVVGRALVGADYDSAGQPSSVGFAGLFAEVARAYGTRYGDPSDAMARIAAKNHANGLANPWAHLHRDFSYDFCRTVGPDNPMVADPLRRTDCSPVSDGAAAVVVTTADRVSSSAGTAGVRLAGMGQANDFHPGSRRDPLAMRGSHVAWRTALGRAGVVASDLSFVELHDCFTIAELVLYEVLGLSEPGKGGSQLAEGVFDRGGALPVNVSGGLKSKGHPVGATGVSQLVLSAMQLTGTAGAMQLPVADVAAVHNMGGLAVANYVHVLRARD
ncbi:thiolase domain-containing protein [Rhodococcus sp. F64268]|uniref:thiolase domain-containing protein n=1 Tax=Rhodococcus sp. F64268 TaxID=2926402 RepID=UPI001FF2D9F2|nr:thiolase domain-containing protein [Rhodococcus sp. F64268]MCK0093840.1 thiolase domain-containing protein [Rhodococcus sp. F64268]